MIRCYLFNGQITTDTVEMMLLATITYEVYCTSVHFEHQHWETDTSPNYKQTIRVYFTATDKVEAQSLKSIQRGNITEIMIK